MAAEACEEGHRLRDATSDRADLTNVSRDNAGADLTFSTPAGSALIRPPWAVARTGLSYPWILLHSIANRRILVDMNEQRRKIKRSQSLEEALDTLQAERKRVELALEKASLRRQKALDDAGTELERIGDLAMDAIDAGSTASDVCRIGGVSRRTLYKMLDDRGYARHRNQ